jgi:hypothetical protein
LGRLRRHPSRPARPAWRPAVQGDSGTATTGTRNPSVHARLRQASAHRQATHKPPLPRCRDEALRRRQTQTRCLQARTSVARDICAKRLQHSNLRSRANPPRGGDAKPPVSTAHDGLMRQRGCRQRDGTHLSSPIRAAGRLARGYRCASPPLTVSNIIVGAVEHATTQHL